MSLMLIGKVILGIIGALLVWRNPRIGLYIAGFSIPFLPFIHLTILIVGTLGVFLIKSFWENKLHYIKTPIDIPLIFFILLWIGGTLTSISPSKSLKALQIHGIAVLFVFLCIYMLKKKEHVLMMALSLIVSATFTSFYGIIQYFFVGTTSESWVDVKLNPDLATRVFATMDNPNNLAEYLVLLIPLAVALAFYKKDIWQKSILFFASMVMIICLLLTFSRGGWLGFFVAGFVFVLCTYKRLILVGMALLPFIVIALPNTILNRIGTISSLETSLQDSSIAYRVNIWHAATKIIKDFWWGGVGFGNESFMSVYPLYKEWAHIAWHAHNLYLEIAVEMGILGLLLFLWLIFNFTKYSLLGSFSTIDLFKKWMLIGGVTGIIGGLVNGVAEYIWFYSKVLLTFWVVIGLTLAIYNLNKEKKDTVLF